MIAVGFTGGQFWPPVSGLAGHLLFCLLSSLTQQRDWLMDSVSFEAHSLLCGPLPRLSSGCSYSMHLAYVLRSTCALIVCGSSVGVLPFRLWGGPAAPPPGVWVRVLGSVLLPQDPSTGLYWGGRSFRPTRFHFFFASEAHSLFMSAFTICCLVWDHFPPGAAGLLSG